MEIEFAFNENAMNRAADMAQRRVSVKMVNRDPVLSTKYATRSRYDESLWKRFHSANDRSLSPTIYRDETVYRLIQERF